MALRKPKSSLHMVELTELAGKQHSCELVFYDHDEASSSEEDAVWLEENIQLDTPETQQDIDTSDHSIRIHRYCSSADRHSRCMFGSPIL